MQRAIRTALHRIAGLLGAAVLALLAVGPAPAAEPAGEGRVRVIGPLARNWEYSLQPGMTLEDLILPSGKPDKLDLLADIRRIELRRAGKPVRVIDLTRRARGERGGILLQAGDQVYVPRFKDTLIVIGAVPNPGPRPFRPGQSVREFFATGLDLYGRQPAVLGDADLGRVQLIRIEEGKPGKLVELDLEAVLRNVNHPDNVPLQRGDGLHIPKKQGGS